MGRKLDLPHSERNLQIWVLAIDEGWELWLYENGKRMALGATVGIDAAIEAWRAQKDAILLAADMICHDLENGKIKLPPAAGDGTSPGESSSSSS